MRNWSIFKKGSKEGYTNAESENNIACKIPLSIKTETRNSIERIPSDKLILNINKDKMTKNGYYSFKNITEKESNQLIQLITTSKKNGKYTSLVLIEYTLTSYLYRNKYLVEQIVIEQFKNSNSLYDNLAVGLAYLAKGSVFRAKAIFHLENFLSKVTDSVWNELKKVNELYFNKAKIFFILSELYEKEAFIEKAYDCALIASKVHGVCGVNYDRVGDILVKIDINQAVDYYKKELVEKPEFSTIIQQKLEKALEKQKKNYKYKPRKIRKDYNQEFEEELKATSLKYLQYF